MEAISQGQRFFIIRLAVGLVQGLILYLLYSAGDDKVWPATQGAVFAPLLITWIFIPAVLILALGEMPWRKAILWAGIATLVTAGLALFDNWSAWPQDWVYGPTGNGFSESHWQPHIMPSWKLFVLGGAGLFIAHALVVGGSIDRRFMASYPTHFDTAWKLAVQLALAGVFVGAFWLLLWLGAGLFKLINLDFFERLISHKWFWMPATTLSASGALHLTDIRPALVRGARTLLLTLLSWLLPLITLIAAGFVISLPFTGLEALWSTRRASVLLLTATGALVLLINTAHQDGDADRLPPRLLRFSGVVAALLLAPLALIAAYALFLRVQQHGWSVDRFTLAVSIVVALGYAAGYAWAVFKRGPWLHFIKTWNFYMALLTLSLIVALFTPVASPARIAVADQMARLNSGKISISKFDFTFLRWDGGRYGRDALIALAASADPYTKRKAREVAQETSKNYNADAETEAFAERLKVYPAGAKLPKSFVRMDWKKKDSHAGRPACPTWSTCSAILADLDGDGRPEIMIYRGDADFLQVFRETANGVWSEAGNIDLPYNCHGLIGALQQGHFGTSEPLLHWKDLIVGDLRLSVGRGFRDRPACTM